MRKLAAEFLSTSAGLRTPELLLRLTLPAILLTCGGFAEPLTAFAEGPKVEQPAQHLDKHGNLKGKDAIPFSYVDDPIVAIVERVPELLTLESSDDQEILSSILVNTGQRVQLFLNDIVDITATEDVMQEKLYSDGDPKDKRKERFDYMILARSPGDARLLEEYRTDLRGNPVDQGGLEQGYTITWGFATTCLHLAPRYQGGSRFRYLGTDRFNSSEVYVVAFAQRPDKAQITGKVSIGDFGQTLFTQGIVWIAKSNFQILRMRTDLLKPGVIIKQTTDVKFADVHVEGLTQTFWLPQEVTVESKRIGERLRNRHQYSNYRRFRVSAVIKPGNS